jgi:hypothetical protein
MMGYHPNTTTLTAFFRVLCLTAIFKKQFTLGLHQLIQQRKNNLYDINALLFDICRNENKQVAGKVAVLLWCIWHNRNNKVWNNNTITAQQIGMQAAHMWHE